MAFVIRADERPVPWYDRNEFFEVFSYLIDSELESKYMALNRLKIWVERSQGITKQCPIAVISTSYILNTMLQDGVWDWNLVSKGIKSGLLNNNFRELMEKKSNIESKYYQRNAHFEDSPMYLYHSCIPFSIQSQYCMVITRIINLFVDQSQLQFYARSISDISTELGIPQLLVEIRHQATHGSELPSLESCRVGGILIFQYLITNYWRGQYTNLTESILTFNKAICGYFDELKYLILSLHFDWDIHGCSEKNNSLIENSIILDSYNEYNEYYHGSLSKAVFEHISTKIPIRNKALQYFREMLNSPIKDERRRANKMIKALTIVGKHNSNVKLRKLKKWVKNCYDRLPVFYRFIGRTIATMNNNEVDETVVKDYVINELINSICPLCCPISEILALYLFKFVSDNIRIEVLSMLITKLFENSNSYKNDTRPCKSEIYKHCKQSQKVRYFYWLRVLLPDPAHIHSGDLPSGKKLSRKVIEPILLLTFYKSLEKANTANKFMNVEKIIDTLNSSKYSMFIVFSELIGSIPGIIYKNNTKLNDSTSSVIQLLSDLKIFDSTSKLIRVLLNENKELSSGNVKLIKQFLRIGESYPTKDDYSSNVPYVSSRGVIVEEFSITPMLKAGTSWDKDRMEIIHHIHTSQNITQSYEDSNTINQQPANMSYEDEALSYVELNDNTYSSENHPVKTITLGMEHNNYAGDNNTPMNMCLLNAEMLMRKNVGIKERLNEIAINIDWSKVKHLSEL
ncbi:hypothetical protein OIY81_3269 [Cryptosporidium canis]|uniref:Las1-like family protein n=1 Tax=Cryptosporidium canis TaxID=195482 RepID=A0ABQ8P700_9CRYT|nr:hypothetical protein OIY81_3269 [Cryptosporidium canis]KAJ1610429.1 hypothetical protein OJ252_1906 [Cryptosporidium canis]